MRISISRLQSHTLYHPTYHRKYSDYSKGDMVRLRRRVRTRKLCVFHSAAWKLRRPL